MIYEFLNFFIPRAFLTPFALIMIYEFINYTYIIDFQAMCDFFGILE
jgi:hypothetical protein